MSLEQGAVLGVSAEHLCPQVVEGAAKRGQLRIRSRGGVGGAIDLLEWVDDFLEGEYLGDYRLLDLDVGREPVHVARLDVGPLVVEHGEIVLELGPLLNQELAEAPQRRDPLSFLFFECVRPYRPLSRRY